MEKVTVPKVEMVKETVVVPDVRIERQHKMMPVTVTRLVPVQRQEVVMKCVCHHRSLCQYVISVCSCTS